MSRDRSAIAVLILCLLGGYGYNRIHNHSNKLLLPSFTSQDLRDSVAQNPSGAQGQRGHSDLTLGADDNNDLKDSVAEGPAIVTGRGISHGQPVNGGPNGNPPNPRGGTYGSVGGGSNQNPYSQTAPPILSPSGPQ